MSERNFRNRGTERKQQVLALAVAAHISVVIISVCVPPG
jgi:hypothetical protein